jgi:predicted nucleic acid-binding protein
LEKYCIPLEIQVPSEIRDPKDEPIVALATATKAIIVTGDKDFLEHEGDLGAVVIATSEAMRVLG